MITKISGSGFKDGIKFSQELTQHNLLIGPNGSGKSKVSQAYTLASLGYIPGSGKKPGEIMRDFSNGKKLVVSFVHDGKEFERAFSYTDTGAKQKLRIAKKTQSKDAFNLALGGVPKPFDLSTFTELSHKKQIAMIFDLFPPPGNVGLLDEKIEKLTEKRNSLQAELTVSTGTATRLTKSKSDINLPAGTLAETQAELKSVREKYQAARDDLKEAELEEEKAEIKEKAKADAITEMEERLKAETAKKDIEEPKKELPHTLEDYTSPEMQAAENKLQHRATAMGHTGGQPESLKKVLEAFELVDCDVCLAKTVCGVELRKLS